MFAFKMADGLSKGEYADFIPEAPTKRNLEKNPLMLQNVVVSDTTIGSGQFGVVHEAKFCGAACAAKRYPQLLSKSKSLFDRFMTECQTWAKMKHPHIAPLLGLNLSSEVALPLLVMEKMDTSLHQLLAHCLQQISRGLSLSQKAFILLQVALGLAYLHQLNPPAIHGNLTASNVLIALPSLTAKISDFGMARVMESTGTSPPQAACSFWAPLYTAPELEDCEQVAESDIYSYGVLIIHTVKLQLSKLLPLRAKQEKRVVYRTDFQRRASDIESFADDEKALFMGIIEKCLEFDPDDRPNALALVSNLENVSSKIDPVELPDSTFSHRQPFDNSVTASTLASIPSNELSSRTFSGLDITQRIGHVEEHLHDLTTQLKVKNDELTRRKRHLKDLNRFIIVNSGKIEASMKLINGYKDLERNSLKWEPAQTIECLKECTSISNNLAQCDGTVSAILCSNFCAPVLAQVTVDADMQIKASKIKLQDLPKHFGVNCNHPSVAQHALAHVNGYMNTIGGCSSVPLEGMESLSNFKKATLSNKVLSLSLTSDVQTPAWQDVYPPVRQVSEESVALSYKHTIVVVHKMGVIELLDTSNDKPDWRKLEPSPFSRTEHPSAVVVGSHLIAWLGTLYCTNLDDVLTQLPTSAGDPLRSPQGTVHVSWSVLPLPPNAKHSTAVCLTCLNLQLIAIFDEHEAEQLSTSAKEERMFAFSCSSGEWVCIGGHVPKGATKHMRTYVAPVSEGVILSVCHRSHDSCTAPLFSVGRLAEI